MSDENPITPLTPEQTAAQEARTLRENPVVRDLVALDQAANVLTGGLPDETISSRLARDAEKHRRAGEIGSMILDLFQKDHGAKAEAGDLARAERAEQAEEDSGDLAGHE